MRRRLTWGVILIGAGTYFLLAQMGVLEWSPWPVWPALFIVFGLVSVLAPERPKQVGSGLFFIVLGFWFYACINHWYGLNYHTAWPLLLVASGLDAILVAIIDKAWPAKEEQHHA